VEREFHVFPTGESMPEPIPIVDPAVNPQIIFAAVTVLTNETGNLTKTFTMVNGQVHKQVAANLVRGTYDVRQVNSLKELDLLLDDLNPKQAVTYGRPEQSAGIVVAQSVANPPPDAITRTRDKFNFEPGPGILMLDYDPPKGAVAASQFELIAMLHKACPALKNVEMLWRPSSSSGVDGAEVRGQRVYIMVNDASQIPRIGKLLFDYLWLVGFGYYAISQAGHALERGPIDATVWKPEGLDFAAAPVLGQGVARQRYDSMIIDGCIFDVSKIKDLDIVQTSELRKTKDAARQAVEPEILAAKQKYIAKAKTELLPRLKAIGVDADVEAIGMMAERAAMNHLLMGNWPLTTAEGKTVTVGTIMDNPDKYHNTRFADPLEPDQDRRVAWACLHGGGRPFIHSHAHGGIHFTLDRAPTVINVNVAELPRMVDSAATILKKSGEIYEHAGAMVYVNEDGKIVPAKPQWLAVEIQRMCRFEAWNKKEEIFVAVACPSPIVQGVLADAANLRMDKLTAVRNAPTMDHDGRQIAVPGYDKKTCLLLVNKQNVEWPTIPAAPSHSDLQKAFSELWMPFSQFPYASAADKSVALAAVLTSAVRSCLRTSPGFGFSATAAGTGKTLLAQCIGALYDGVAPAVSPPSPDEQEWAKSLFSAALGGAGTMLFDNAEHAIESASLCAVTTAPSIKSRVLGESREAEAEHRMLILATGNGLQFVGDLNRRFFVCRLDAHMEASKVAAREFQMEPLGYCLKHRLKLVVAALTLIQGYVRAGFPRVCDGLASMDDWNKLVRSTIVWLMEQGVLNGFVDPKLALTRDSENDPDAALLIGVLDTAKNIFGAGRRFTVAELVISANKPLSGVRDLLLDIAGDRGEINAKRLGQYFQKREGRIMNGMSIKRGQKDRQNRATWEVRTS
jgi:hypothetical protein